jgi:hypothetical protein
VTKILLLGAAKEGVNLLHTITKSTKKNGGAAAPKGSCHPPAVGAALLPPPGRRHRHGDVHRHLLHGLHIFIIFINIYINSSSSPSVISWQT